MDIIQRRILASIKTILISSLFILSAVGNAQIVNIGQADNEDRALDITTDMFGNYIILMSDSSSAYVVCADTGMNVLWTRSLEDSDPHNQGQLVELSGGEFLGCMRQDYHSWKSHLFKFNLQGEILWHKTTDLSSVIEDITVFGNEKIAIVGHYAEQQGVTALDKDGNVIWSFRCDPPGFMSYMQNVLTTNDGTLMVVGRHLRVSDQIWMTTLTEVDTSGNVLWDKSFVGTGECTATLQASDNSYYIVSKVRDGNPIHPSSTDIAIVKLSKDGTFMNAKRYGNQYTDMAYDIIEDTEGNLMAFCKSEPAWHCGSNLLALKIDSELDTLFTKINGEQSGFGGFYRRLHQLKNGFLFCGYGNLWSPTSAYTSSIVKTNANFEIDCKRYTQTIWVENLDFPESLTSTMMYQASIGYVWQSLDSTGTKNVVIEDGCPEQNDEDNGNGNDGGDALGLDAQSEESLVQAYPNPTTGSIRINVSSKLKNGGVEVFNPIGVLIDRKSIMSYDYIDFVLPEIQGVYLIRLSAPNGFSETLKVIKE